MPKSFFFFICLFISSQPAVQAQPVNASLNLVPMPQTMVVSNDGYQLPATGISYYTGAKGLTKAENFTGKLLFNGGNKKTTNLQTANLRLLIRWGLDKEGYELVITGQGIVLSASTDAGLLYGLQTLQQMYLLAVTNNNNVLPAVTIKDHPAFAWRGVELDVARHFFSKTYIYKFIDLLSAYKFNKLHLHLTDDQGWRIEIKKYPKLTEQGAWRTFNNQDSACLQKAVDNPDFNLPAEHIRMQNGQQVYGGFYTQQDIRDIVQYAGSKNIEVIPEIDMPGHMMVATQAYPELLLDNSTAGWGELFSVPVCPCKESTYTFMQNVLTEIIALFPSKYIHMGADEVEKTSWQQSALCQEWMRKKNTKDLHELQSYFVLRMNKFIRSKGKVAIGWDEILDGPSDPSMTVMYWRGWEKKAPATAVQRGHKVVMTPTNPMYFDYLPNSSTLEAVYRFTVIPADMQADKKQLVLGGQANVWTEMIPSRERLEFMILPRLSALSERIWTNKELYESYRQRLISHYRIWDKQDLRYRMPDLGGFADEQVLVDGKSVLTVHNPLPGTRVHYTVDGSTPAASSPVLQQTLTLTDTGRVRFATISDAGAKSELYQVRVKNGQWIKSLDAAVINKNPGLAVSFYNGVFANTTKMKGEVIRRETIANVHLADTIKMPAFGVKIRGLIQVPEKGIYSFYFTCDDGGVLKIADQVVIDNDGQHAPVMKSGQIALEAGFHPFHIDFIEAGGGFTLKLQYSVNGSPVQAIPDDWFYNMGQ